jgi:hypothetical protein
VYGDAETVRDGSFETERVSGSMGFMVTVF